MDLEYLDDLDAGSALPPSAQIAAKIRAAIADGVLRPGDRLPSQAELRQRYGIARETARAALRQLAHDGLISGGQGRRAYVLDGRQMHSTNEELRILAADVEALRSNLQRNASEMRRIGDRLAELAGRRHDPSKPTAGPGASDESS